MSPFSQPPQPPPPGKGSGLTLLLAALLGLSTAVLLAVLVTVSLGPVGIAMVVIGAGIFLVAGLQYAIWGWWLGRKIRGENPKQDE